MLLPAPLTSRCLLPEVSIPGLYRAPLTQADPQNAPAVLPTTSQAEPRFIGETQANHATEHVIDHFIDHVICSCCLSLLVNQED